MPKGKRPSESLTDNAELLPGETLVGRRINPETGEVVDAMEAQHYIRCDICGGMFDMRDLVQVIHHDQKKHGFMTDPAWDALQKEDLQN